MSEKRFLNEENYQKSKNKVIIIAIIVLAIGVLIGGSLIVTGIVKQTKANSNSSEDSKQSIEEKIATEKKNLETKKTELESKIAKAKAEEKKNLEAKKAELESKGIKYNSSAKYDDGESYDLKIVTNVLDPSYNYCLSDEYENNTLTSTYCSILNKTAEDPKNLAIIDKALDTDFDYCSFDECQNNSLTSKYCSYKQELEYFGYTTDSSNSYRHIPFYIFGGFIIIASCMIAGSIYMFAKGRDIFAFTANQTVPVAKEVIEDVAPSIGKAAGTITKEINDIAGESTANVMGDIAKNISKGIKEGMDEADKDKKINNKNNE